MKQLCTSCPRQCMVNRDIEIGFCQMKNTVKLALVSLHEWEEPVISGTNGSGTIFFSGCNLRCKYCQNWDVSNGKIGKEITIERLAEIFKELEDAGAHNINLVTPSHYTKQIKEALTIYKPNIPIVYNTSGYDRVETLKELDGFIDIYLTDYKYYDEELAQQYSQARNYPKIVVDAIDEMVRQQPKQVMENGLLKKGVIIRHMILPNYSGDSVKILEDIAKRWPEVIVSIMSQYTPCYLAKEDGTINRPISKLEYSRVLASFHRVGLKNGFMQELASSTTEYIPNFNLKNVEKLEQLK